MTATVTPLYSQQAMELGRILSRYSTPDEAFTAFVDFLTETFRLNSVLYGVLPMASKGEVGHFTREWMVLHNRPNALMHRYQLGGEIEDDPDIAYCRKNKIAVRWYDEALWRDASPAQLAARDDFFAEGLANGITIPIDITSGTQAGIGIGTSLLSRDEFEQLLTDHFSDIESLSRVFHHAVMENGWAAKIYGLTRVELKTLSYLASGFTVQVIARRDGVSVGAVEERLRSARKRLGALSSTAAVSKATALNLIKPVEHFPQTDGLFRKKF